MILLKSITILALQCKAEWKDDLAVTGQKLWVRYPISNKFSIHLLSKQVVSSHFSK